MTRHLMGGLVPLISYQRTDWIWDRERVIRITWLGLSLAVTYTSPQRRGRQ